MNKFYQSLEYRSMESKVFVCTRKENASLNEFFFFRLFVKIKKRNAVHRLLNLRYFIIQRECKSLRHITFSKLTKKKRNR